MDKYFYYEAAKQQLARECKDSKEYEEKLKIVRERLNVDLISSLKTSR